MMSANDFLRREACPKGPFHVGLNLSNTLLVMPDDPQGNPTGIAPDLARQIGQLLDAPIVFHRFAKPNLLADAIRDEACDLGFLADEPQRAEQISFADAYLGIDATYMTRPGLQIDDIAQVDRPGMRIVVVGGAAYELWLTRNIKSAALIRTTTVPEAHRLFKEGQADIMAGLRVMMQDEVRDYPGGRVLEGNFTTVRQSIAIPKGRPAVQGFLQSFVQTLRTEGRVAELIMKHKVSGVSPIVGAD